MSTKRVASGQSVGRYRDSSMLNYLLEGAERAHRQSTGPGETRPRQAGIALIRNNTGADLDRFDILGIEDILIDPADGAEELDSFRDGFSFLGATPTTTRDGAGRFAILQEPCDVGEIARCVFSGLTVAYVNVPDNETYTGASLLNGDVSMLSADNGSDCTIIWHEPGSGKKLAVVHLGSGAAGESTSTATSGDCGCGDCIDAGSISACGVIGDAPLNFRFAVPAGLVAGFGQAIVLTHTSSCTWESDTFDQIDLGDGLHDYTWKLVFTGTSVEEAVLTLEDEA